MRRGVATLADGEVDDHGRLKIPLEVDVIAEGGTPRTETIRPSMTVYGPGDVNGVDPSAIVRVVPANGVRDFEANFFCAVEFYDEDFPWRYTPRIANAKSLAPWLWVVALADDEFSVLAPTIIEIEPAALRTALPDPETTAAWAHVQIDSAIEGTDVAAARIAIRQLLDANPNAGCSRIVCPRRLAPGTHYTAFLVPAFERGRLAGLGTKAADIEKVPADKPSWPGTGALQFPVYHQWQFTTSTEGDFEDLARKLHAVPSTTLAGDVLLDIQEPGWNTHYRSTKPDRPQPGAVAMPTAVRVPGERSALSFGGDPADATLATELRSLLSAGDTDDDDPFVLPPRYGSTYRAAALGEPAATWYEQVNLDPSYRAISGMGAAAVRENQESYIDRVWDRLREALEKRADTQRWQLSLHASIQLFAKRFAPVLAVETTATTDAAELARRESRLYRALAVAAPVHARIDVAGAPLATAVRAMPYASAFRGGFTKVTRAGGPLMRRLASTAVATATVAPRMRRVFEFHTPPRIASSAIQAALAGAAQAASGSDFDMKMQRAGLGSGAAVAAAVTALQARLSPAPMQMVIATAPGELVAALHTQLAPRRTIPARMREVLAIAIPATEEAAERIDLPTFQIELPDPMYRTLAHRTELIVPGLGQLPENGVTMLDPDANFIEAFMLGVNHEIMRELLWREVPVPLDATIFRQFWDVRDNPNAIADPQRFRDILPIAGWGTTKLGDPSHRPQAMRGALTVVVMRGDLLRKYPNAEVLVHPAAWVAQGNRKVRREAKNVESRPPLFSARIAPDVTLLGFQLDGNDAIGDPSPDAEAPGWYFVVKERAGDVHFGLDIDASANDPSWSALGDVPIGACIDTRAASFRALPRYAANADGIAAMLYQRPFSMYVHASRLLHRS